MGNISQDEKAVKFQETFAKAKGEYAEHLKYSTEFIKMSWELIQREPGNAEAVDRLITEAHKIAGSGATFGYQTCSAAASKLEELGEELKEKGQNTSFCTVVKIAELIDFVKLSAHAETGQPAPRDAAPAHEGQTGESQTGESQAEPVPADIELEPLVVLPVQSEGQPRLKVLVVDDDRFFRESIRLMLAEYDYEVLEAANGREGFDEALFNAPNVIISDYKMPDGGGPYFLGRLTSTPETSKIPVILVTASRVRGRTSFAVKREMMSYQSVTDYIEKPVAQDALLKAVTAHMAVH